MYIMFFIDIDGASGACWISPLMSVFVSKDMLMSMLGEHKLTIGDSSEILNLRGITGYLTSSEVNCRFWAITRLEQDKGSKTCFRRETLASPRTTNLYGQFDL